MSAQKSQGSISGGWIPDLPDIRDFSADDNEVVDLLQNSDPRVVDALGVGPKSKSDLVKWFPPIEDQGSLGSCTAQAVVGLVEYYQNRKFGKWLDASRLFLYKVTRNLLGWSGDTGAYIRETIKALRLCGICPERYWPYIVSKFDDEPPVFCYSLAKEWQAVSYVRLSDLPQIRTWLSLGYPVAFGFTVYNSIASATQSGDVPFPKAGDYVVGGHAVVAAGHDNNQKKVIFRNSWGKGWGKNGYGTLPYKYFDAGLCKDFWVLIKNEWIDLGQFD